MEVAVAVEERTVLPVLCPGNCVQRNCAAIVKQKLFTQYLNPPEQLSFRSRPSPGQATAEIQWADFYQNLLLKGEVQEIIIHAGVNRLA